jgi:Na+/H+ antiporter NhaD/arsenite permease-like protein
VIFTLAVFAATYGVIAVGRVPGLRLDRAGAALLGAALMVAGGALSLTAAYAAIDLNTIVLLLGMMILVANLRLAGFFEACTAFASRHARRPLLLLLAVVLVSGLLSAFLVNDTVCLMMAPLVAEITLAMKRRVEPYLIALAMASNAGSVATITGNPQNMVIASVSHLSYVSFAEALTPVALISLAIVALVVVLLYRGEFAHGVRLDADLPRAEVKQAALARSLAVTLGAIIFFFLGVPPAEVAIVAGSVLLLTTRLKPAQLWSEIDWPLLVMFAGLFIVVRGLEVALFTPAHLAVLQQLDLAQPPKLAAVSAVLANLVSNVPSVLLLKSFIPGVADPRRAYLVLAMASTLAGNLTITGSVANLIVVERARQAGIQISFWRYLMVGIPVTFLTVAFGVWWLG